MHADAVHAAVHASGVAVAWSCMLLLCRLLLCCHHAVVQIAGQAAVRTAAVHADVVHVAACLLSTAIVDNAYHLE